MVVRGVPTTHGWLGGPLETRSAELFIASEADQMAHIRWRVNLVDSQGLYPAKDMTTLLKRVSSNSNNKPSLAERRELSDYATGKKFDIDELDQAILFSIILLSAEKGISDYVAINTDSILRFELRRFDGSLEEFASEPDVRSQLEFRKNALRSYAEKLLEIDGSRIRSYLAFKELVALFDPDVLVPHLVSLSPKYLASVLTQKWIRKHQYYSRFGDTPEILNESGRHLKALSKALVGDRRRQKKRERPYWQLAFTYDDLTGYIDGFRRQKREGVFESRMLEIYLEQREIPERFRDLILDSYTSSSELALEIMIEKKLLKSPKTFREVQAKVNKIQEKHFEGNILQIATDVKPVVFDFIDLPGMNPEFMGRVDLLSSLEKL